MTEQREYPAAAVVRSVEGPIVTLRINRPEGENRLNLAVLEALCSGLEDAERDENCRAVVITGTGDTFCCGGDVAEFAAGDTASYTRFGERFAALHLGVARLSKPVLAAVNGDARAGGMSLLAICDLAVARRSARFAMPEIRYGLWPVMAMVSLNRVLPRKRALELYYFGESFGSEDALRLDLVNWAVPDGEFDAAVEAQAQRLAELPPASVRIGKKTFAGIGERSYEDGFAFSAGRLVELLTDPQTVAALAGGKGKEKE